MDNDPMQSSHQRSTPDIDVLERLAKLPQVAYLDNAGGKANASTHAPVVAVHRGVMGCYPVYTMATADALNQAHGITRGQAEAMYAGSMFGWEVPAADPDGYNADGTMRR